MPLIPRPFLVRSAVALLLLLALPCLGGASAAAQAPAGVSQAEATGIAEELARLNRTLTRIAELMERQAEGTRLDLSLRRLAMESERVTALEKEIQNLESERTSLVDERFAMRSRLAMIADGVEQETASASPEELLQIERMAAEAQRMMDHVENRIEAQDRRILEVRNELTRRRADLQALQDRLDRQLDGM